MCCFWGQGTCHVAKPARATAETCLSCGAGSNQAAYGTRSASNLSAISLNSCRATAVLPTIFSFQSIDLRTPWSSSHAFTARGLKLPWHQPAASTSIEQTPQSPHYLGHAGRVKYRRISHELVQSSVHHQDSTKWTSCHQRLCQ